MRTWLPLARRVVFLIAVVIGVTMITFALSRVAPGDPARMIAGPRASTELVESIREDLGLDRPLPEQYLRYAGELLEGDLGLSIQTGRPVAAELVRRIPATLELMLCTLIVTLCLGIPLGAVAAAYKDRWPDQIIRGASALAISTPAFWLALLLLFLFYQNLDWAPAGGRIDGAPPSSVTGFYLIDALLAGDLPALADALHHLALPVLTLSLISAGSVVRIIRASMLDVLSEDYIRTARANGFSERRVIGDHALRNALIPFVTVLGMGIAEMLYGAVIVETIFSWPGTGAYVANAIFNLDFPVIMGFTLIASIFYVLVNLSVDLIYARLDPQMREAV